MKTLIALLLALGFSAKAQQVFVGPIVPSDGFLPPALWVIAEQWPMQNCEIQFTFDLGWGDIHPGPTFNQCYPETGFVMAGFDVSATNAYFRSWQTPCAVELFPRWEQPAPPLPPAVRDFRFSDAQTQKVYRPESLPSQFGAVFPFREIPRARMVPVKPFAGN